MYVGLFLKCPMLHWNKRMFWGVSSPLCVEKTNNAVNISHETTTMVVWVYDGV